MPAPTQRELRAAQKLGASIPKLMAADVVIATLPDGSRLLVKGRERLDCIIASDNGADSHIALVPVLSLETAVALEQQLGGDGSYTRPGPVGHA